MFYQLIDASEVPVDEPLEESFSGNRGSALSGALWGELRQIVKELFISGTRRNRLR
jgi:hypothetical protein